MKNKGNNGNDANLKKIRTSEEAKRIGSLGGIKSGEARREKRDLKKCFEIGLEALTAKVSKELYKSGDKDQSQLVNAIGVGAYSMLKIALDKKVSPQTRAKAWDSIFDRVEGKPITKNLLQANITSEIGVISEEDRDIIKNQINREANKIISNNKNNKE